MQNLNKSNLKNPTRRVVITGAITACLTSRVTGQTRPAREPLIIFLPGVMGSTLTQGSELWSKDFLTIYRILVTQGGSALLVPGYAQTEILDEVGVSSFPLKQKIYKSLLDAILEQPSFAPDHAHLFFSYDWRKDFDTILARLRSLLAARGIIYRDNQAMPSNHRIILVGHSMGALLSVMAVAKRVINPADVAGVILIAPPMRGAPTAFRCLSDGTPIAFVNSAIWWAGLLWRRRAAEAMEALHENLLQIDSSFELLPPADTPGYVAIIPNNDNDMPSCNDGSYQFGRPLINPLESAILPANQRHAAIAHSAEFHSLLLTVAKEMGRERMHVLYTDGKPTELQYVYSDHIRNICTKKEGGDGTVPRSSAFPQELADLVTPVKLPNTEEHLLLCEDKTVIKFVIGEAARILAS